MSSFQVDDSLARIIANSRLNGFGVYLGNGREGPFYAPPQHGALILGPPRSGKTSSVIVPNVLASSASVLSVSTKRDVLEATFATRLLLGECLLFDPSATVQVPDGVRTIGWSPLSSATDWDQAILSAGAMVGAARTNTRSADGAHWIERAEALLACIFHAAALDRASMHDVVAAINRHDATRFLSVLSKSEATIALDLLVGICETDAREQSGIWSTCSGVLAGYRSQAALNSATGTLFDAKQFVSKPATLYIAAAGELQHQLAPLVAGIIRDVRSAAFVAEAERSSNSGLPRSPKPSVLLVLDELANIAPLHDLPALVSEGASQGLLTLASLQDLSQARDRWGVAADGFLSLFGTKMLLAGIGDVKTLEALSTLSGQHEVPVVTRSTSGPWQGPRRSTRTFSTRTAPRLSPDQIASPMPGTALAIIGTSFRRIALSPYFATSPWREAIQRAERSRRMTLGQDPRSEHRGPNPRSDPSLGL